ncbi:hypothetical protein RJ639_011792 [Escallonia herrerae]|uniref:Uncharacterized protein n=1 Tax=Escallonia herrerae TaxID=1293975 RepID=A0AA88VJU0_9ASTE|nr:hypothetical protein RJ639_011792 [Escallonia herrerae]
MIIMKEVALDRGTVFIQILHIGRRKKTDPSVQWLRFEGVYSVSIDSQDGLAKVSGEVDPNILLRALARTGNHAELVWVKLKHPVLARGFQGSYGYGKYHNPYGYGSTLYDHPWHDAHQPYHSRRRPQVDYPWCNTTYRHGYGGYGRGSFYGHGYGYGHHNHGF